MASALVRLREAWHAYLDPDTAEKGRQTVMGEIALADSRDRLFTNPTQAFLKYNPNLLARRKGFALYELMANDDQLKAALSFKRYAVLASGWEIVSPEQKPKDWEPAVVVRGQMLDIDNTLEHTLDEVLTALTYGFSLSEKVWKPEGSYVELECLKTIHPRDILFEMDGFGNTTRILQGVTVELPQEKMFHFVHAGYFRNPYGESDFNAAYRAWWVKDNAYKWMAMLLERMGIPPVFALYDVNALSAYVGPIKDALASIQAGTYGALPRGKDKDSLEMWAPRLAENVDKVFIPALDRFDKDMARAILLPGLIGYTPDVAQGSHARAAVNFDAFILVVEKIRGLLSARMNEEVVEDIVDFNFASVDEYPRFRFLPLSDEVKESLFNLWVELLKEGAVRPQTEDEDHIRAALKFPEAGGTPMPHVLPGRPTIIGPDGQIIESTPPPAGEAPPTVEEPSEKGGPDEEGGARSDYGARVRGPKGYLVAYAAYARFARQTPAQAGQILQRGEDELLRRISTALREARDTLIEALRGNDITPKFVDTLRLRKLGDVQSALQDVLRSTWNAGNAQRYEFTPQEAMAYLNQKAMTISGVIRDDLTNDVRQVLLNAIRSGTPLGDVVRQIDAAFEPYLGGPDHLADAMSPHRLETIARTNLTDAYNQGRLTMAKDPDVIDLLAGMRYSSILDDRTTEICTYLSEKIFEMDDPALEQLAPPNHFNAVVAGTKIKSQRGELPIEQIDVGDLVLTHRGRWRRVYAVMSKRAQVHRDLYLSTGRILRITDEHPVLTSAGWFRADGLQLAHELFQHGEQMPGANGVLVRCPDDFPSLFDEEAIAYESFRFAPRAALRAVDFQPNSICRPGEIQNEAADRMLKNERIAALREQRGEKSFAFSGHRAPRQSATARHFLHAVMSWIAAAAHSLARSAGPSIGFLALTPGPMPIAAAFGNDFGSPVRDCNLLFAGSDLDPESFDRTAEGSFPDADGTLYGSNRLATAPMPLGDQVFDFGFGHDGKDDPRWVGASIIAAVEVRGEVEVWNIAVEEDETYHADGIIVHNCRSILVPVTKGEAKEEGLESGDFMTSADVGKALELRGSFAAAGVFRHYKERNAA